MIFLTGDTHGDSDRVRQLEHQAEKQEVTGQDVLIQLGDFGFNFRSNSSSYQVRQHEIQQFQRLDNLPFKDILFIDGNHENFDRLYKEYPTVMKYGATCHKLTDKIFHIHRGEILGIEGKTFLAMGGAPSIDKAWRLAGVDWWPEEEPSYHEMNRTLKRAEMLANQGVPFYMLTHEVPDYVLKNYWPHVHAIDGRMTFLKDFLDKVYGVAKDHIIQWYFGHYHSNTAFGEATPPKFVCLYEDMLPLGGDAQLTREVQKSL